MSLKEFLKLVEKEDEFLHVRNQLSTNFGVSSTIKSLENEGAALLFERIKGYKTKIVANVCGTRNRICKALSVSQDRLYERLMEAWHPSKKTRIVGDSAVKEIVEKSVDLGRIPILTHFEKDAGPYITSAVIHAKSLDEKNENVSIHRLQVLDKKHLAIRLVPRHLFKLWNAAKTRGKDLDIAISVGVHPAVLLAASSPVPFGVNEFDVANTLLNDSLRLLDCEHVNASAPADAELVLEGRISATKEVIEGPFVDVTGTYDIQRKQPLVEVVGVMHRENHFYQALLPSGAEHRLLMGLPHEVLIWNSVSKVVPRVGAVNLTVGGCGWLHATISVEKQVDGDAKNALLAAFAAHPSLKHAVVVDPDINVFSADDVEWAIATRFQAGEDLVIIPNVRGSTLDSSANQETGLTTKLGLDATRPLAKPREKFERAQIPTSECIKKGTAVRKEKSAHQLLYADC